MESDCLTDKRYEHPEGVLDSKENINKHNNLMKQSSHDIDNEVTKLKKHNQQSQDKSHETTNNELPTKQTVEDLKTLCEQLSIINTRVQTEKQFIHFRYDLPNELQQKLEVEAEEFESFYRELQDASKHLAIIHNQRLALEKEKLCIKTQLEKLKSDEINELEIIVSVYDSEMMARWETVKGNNSIQDVKNLLYDVKGKLQAMKNLQILCSHKLTDLQNKEKQNQNVLKKEKKRKNKDTKSNQSRENLNPSNTANFSLSPLPLLAYTNSEGFVGDEAMQSVLFNLVYDQVLSVPSWTQGTMDID